MNKKITFDDWIMDLVKECLPLELQRKILSGSPLTKQEAQKFVNVILLARQAKSLGEQTKILKLLNEIKNAPAWAKQIEASLNASITDARDTIIDTLGKTTNKGGRPDRRGPKNTNMMRCQREAVKVYVEIERHRPISTVTVDDCRHVWNDPDNRAEWNARASRTDSGRGYPNYQALKVGILYWLKQQSRK